MNLKGKIEFVGVDLDGTLFNNDKHLSSATVSAIKNARNRGIHIVPITGRPLSGITDELLSLDEIDFIITSNGAQINCIKDNTAMYSAPIPNSKCLSIIERANERSFYIEAFADSRGYIEPATMALHKKRYENTPILDYLLASREVVDSILELFKNSDKCADEIFLTAHTEQERDEYLKILADDKELELCILGDRYLEITRAGVNKGSAMRFLCNYLGVDMSRTIAFGDGENDASFLKQAQYSVAMENATSHLKELADIVTASNENDGVAIILNEL